MLLARSGWCRRENTYILQQRHCEARYHDGRSDHERACVCNLGRTCYNLVSSALCLLPPASEWQNAHGLATESRSTITDIVLPSCHALPASLLPSAASAAISCHLSLCLSYYHSPIVIARPPSTSYSLRQPKYRRRASTPASKTRRDATDLPVFMAMMKQPVTS